VTEWLIAIQLVTAWKCSKEYFSPIGSSYVELLFSLLDHVQFFYISMLFATYVLHYNVLATGEVSK
jgi:hypothetical protein